MRRIITPQEAGDILTTVLESGYTSSWCEFKDWTRSTGEFDDTLDKLTVKSIVVGTIYEDEEPTVLKHRDIRTGHIIKAWRQIADADAQGNVPEVIGVHPGNLQQFHDNSDEGEAGGIDAWCADFVFQVAALGKVIYG